MKYIYFVLLLLLFSCNKSEKNNLDAETILQESITASGGENLFSSTITFNDNELNYELYRKDNISNYTMTRQVDTLLFKAVYSNGHITYEINDVIQEQTSQGKVFLDTKLEGFIYLLSIPHVLDQNAMILTRKEDVEIDGQSYLTLHANSRVIEDLPQEEFILYINPETFLVDYYAQKYSLFLNKLVFKKATNSRIINGIRFADFQVYYIKNKSLIGTELRAYYRLYNEEKLARQNDIILQNVEVKLH